MAKAYAAQRQLEIGEPLGSGKDGIVVAAKCKSKPARTAIKVFRLDEAYRREKAVYERLKTEGVTAVRGFHVPQLTGFDDNLLVLEMTIVTRPFVLDFAGAYLDRRPEFPEGVLEAWEREKQEQFEERWPEVCGLMAAFGQMRIFLTDISAGNIGLLEVSDR